MKKTFKVNEKQVSILITVNLKTDKPFIRVDCTDKQYFMFAETEDEAIKHFYKIGYVELNALLLTKFDYTVVDGVHAIKLSLN